MNLNPQILNAFLTLMGSVGVLGLLLFFIKKYINSYKKQDTTNNIEILSRVNLNSKNSLITIKTMDKILLIGVSEKNINLISELKNNSVTFSKSDNKTKDSIISNPKVLNKELNQVKNQENDLSFKAFLKSAIIKNN